MSDRGCGEMWARSLPIQWPDQWGMMGLPWRLRSLYCRGIAGGWGSDWVSRDVEGHMGCQEWESREGGVHQGKSQITLEAWENTQRDQDGSNTKKQ